MKEDMFSLRKQLNLGLLVGLLWLQSADAGTITGKVTRPPAATEQRPTVTRYAGRSLAQANAPVDVSCRCNPGLFAVVYLTGDSLPSLSPPDSIPSMAQKDKRFEPSVMAVCVGTEVGFPNLDPFYHNVFSYSSAKKFDLGRYPQGDTKRVRFDKPGMVQIFCEIHYSMRAYVHVLETPYFTVSSDQGDFSIPDIEPGDYTINVWQENLPLLQREITVESDSLYIELE